ncbi:MAG: prepilin-type N-terminal cleavage/methylation domain-containing protein [Bdellovibrionota bacterium]
MKGFTLLELLITMVIIGILSAVAIPQYSEYKQRAYDSSAKTELRNVAIAEEVYFIDAEAYFACSDRDCESLPGITRLSKGVNISIETEDFSFTGTASHDAGTGSEFVWDSENGGLQE